MPWLNLGLQNVRDYFNPDLELEDIKWEAFGTPEWAPDRTEMWPTDYVSSVLRDGLLLAPLLRSSPGNQNSPSSSLPMLCDLGCPVPCRG